MSPETLRIVLNFGADDRAWMRQNKVVVPEFWAGHAMQPALGDALRVGGRQFLIRARVWEHDGEVPVLRLYVGEAQAQSDTVFG